MKPGAEGKGHEKGVTKKGSVTNESSYHLDNK